jgi:WD40 repeat protein
MPAIEFERDVKACQILPDGRRGLATDGETMIQFDLTSGKTQRSIKIGRGVSEAVAISSSGDRIVCCDGSKIQLWNVLSGLEIPSKLLDRDIQWGATFSPDGRLLYTGGNGKVNVWDTSKQQRIATLETAGKYYVKTIAVSSDGQLVATIPSSVAKELQVFRAPRP